MNDITLCRRVEMEKFQKLVKSLYLTLVSQIIIVLLLANYLVERVGIGPFLLWCAVFTLLCTGCFVVGELYKKDKKKGKVEEKFSFYRNISMFFTFLLGAFWSATAFSHFYAPLEQKIIVILILVGQSAGSVMALAPNMRLFYAGVPVSLLPLGFALVWLGDQAHSILGGLLIVFFVFVSYLAHIVNGLVTESIRLRFINDDLLQEKSTFLASASHDLRQPLHALTLYISALEQNSTQGTSRELVRKIKGTLGSLQRLFNGLLDVSKFDAGACQPQMTDILWSDITNSVSNEFGALAEQKNIVIYWSEINFCLYSDPLLLEQIIRNLIGNAIRYTDNGSITINCVRAPDIAQNNSNSNQQIRIDVIDTGVGIKKQYQDNIFRKYYKAPSSNAESSGLGLSIAKRLATALGHQLEFSSEEGVGSCFSVLLNEGDSENVDVVVQEAIALEDSLQREATNILVIDGDASVRDATQQLLVSWGCDVRTAESLHEALFYVTKRRFTPDGIITDSMVVESIGKEVSGEEAIIRIQACCSLADIPAVVLSGENKAENVKGTIDCGCQIMKKPLKPAALRAFVINTRNKGGNVAKTESLQVSPMQSA